MFHENAQFFVQYFTFSIPSNNFIWTIQHRTICKISLISRGGECWIHSWMADLADFYTKYMELVSGCLFCSILPLQGWNFWLTIKVIIIYAYLLLYGFIVWKLLWTFFFIFNFISPPTPVLSIQIFKNMHRREYSWWVMCWWFMFCLNLVFTPKLA